MGVSLDGVVTEKLKIAKIFVEKLRIVKNEERMRMSLIIPTNIWDPVTKLLFSCLLIW